MTDNHQSFGDAPLTTEGIDDASPGVSSDASGDASEGSAGAVASPSDAALLPSDSRPVRIAKTVGWVAFTVGCLVVFTLLKLPEDRIKNYVQGMIASVLAPKGITFQAERGYISIGWGISYVMKNVTFNFPPPDAPAHIEKISVTPSILPSIFGYQGGSLWIDQGEGTLSASFSMKGSQMSASFKAKAIDFGKIGLLPVAAGIHGGMTVTGDGSFSGDSSVPSTMSGDADLTLSKLVIDQQAIMGFSIPRLMISEGKIELNADKGKATIKTFRLGKAGSADDIQATSSGDILLGRNWDASTLNAKANLKLSDTLMKSFALIDAFLGAGKQGDGSYSLTLSGPLTSPNPTPIPPGSK